MKKIYILLITMFVVNGAMAQWFPQNSGTTQDIHSVYFTDTITGYAVGDNGTIIKTQDGGINWTIQNSGTSNDLGSVFFTHSDTGYAVGHNQVFYGGIILKTTNGGLDWRIVYNDSQIGYTDIHFPNSDKGYAVGSSNFIVLHGTVMKTIDGGENWYYSGSLPAYCVFFTDTSTGYVLGGGRNSGYRIYKTTDGGTNWTEQIPDFPGNSIYFPSFDTGYLACNRAILKTNNGGLNWEVVYNSINGYSSYDVYFINTTVGYVIGAGGRIMKTEDGGSNWTTQESENYGELFSVYFPAINTGYVVGEGGTILKTTNGGYPFGTNDLSSESSTVKIYPIPASDQITISTPIKGFLTILNLSGQRLLQQEITETKTQLNISELPSGVYFVRVTVERTVQVGKFVKR